ncbi:MAG: MerC domain-containing protein [Cyclobacteriaceae bacterium]
MKNKFVGLHSDFMGFSASLLCAIHCAALPFLLTLAPLAGLQFLGNPWVEYTFILLSFGIACYALIPGYRRHRQPLALILVLVGFILIGAAHSVVPEAYEAVFTPVGATIIAIAHLINWRQLKQVQTGSPSHIHSPQKKKQNA